MRQIDRRLQSVLDDVLREHAAALRKFPSWPTDPLHAVAVVQEEVGELTQAVLQTIYEPAKSNPSHVAKEAVQAAAMALRFLVGLNHYEYVRADEHDQEAD
jgi:NTP pyrophosphatase (non-canonical NTP hydrolase)